MTSDELKELFAKMGAALTRLKDTPTAVTDLLLLVKMLEELKTLQASGDLDKLIEFCQMMENRPTWVLAILAKLI